MDTKQSPVFRNFRIRQDATDPKQKAVTDYKQQEDRPPPTAKLKSRRTNTTTTDITTKEPNQ
jgi:hypothetical protein